MSDTHPVPGRRNTAAEAMMSDFPSLEREPTRTSERSSARGYQVPEPHEKYELFEEEIPAGMDAMWLPTRIAGMPNPQVSQYYRAHWQPAAAKDFPRVSGFGTEFPEAMIAAGLLENVKPDAPIVIDDQMLVLRPKEFSAKAMRQHRKATDDQVANQMARLKQAYRNAGGVGIRRGHGALPNLAPQGDEE